MGLASSVDRRQHQPLFLDLDRNFVASCHGPIGLGEVEDRCRRIAACRLIFRRRLRSSHQRRNAHAVGPLHRYRVSDGNRLEFALSNGQRARDVVWRSVDRLAWLLRNLPRASSAEGSRLRGDQVSAALKNEVLKNDRIVFEDVSKFYGEILGVNRVNLSIPPGVTSLVGPNGSGKTTLMNLMTGLVRPTQGKISVLGLTPDQPEELFRHVGYCTQFDSFPKGVTGYQFIHQFLRLRGLTTPEAHRLTMEAIERVSMAEAAHRKVAAYSKGM